MVAQRDPYEFPAIRAFAAELAAWRGELSKVELAETLGYTPQLIGQLEAGKNIPSRKFAEDADTYFTTNGLFVRLWKLITETRHFAVLPSGFREFVALEAQASTMYVFEPSVIKGIFQTREYAYEVMKAGRGPEQIEQLSSPSGWSARRSSTGQATSRCDGLRRGGHTARDRWPRGHARTDRASHRNSGTTPCHHADRSGQQGFVRGAHGSVRHLGFR
jgi:DNA-binding XRE family transcriptional regulator